MIDKIAASVAEALADVRDGATVLIGGFGTAGIPGELIDGLIAQGARELTVVNNNAGNGDRGLAALLAWARRSPSSTSRSTRASAPAWATWCPTASSGPCRPPKRAPKASSPAKPPSRR